jgi:hypothetical protein
MGDHQFGYLTKLAKRTRTCHAIRATLDEGPRSNKIEQYYRLRAINWIHGLYLRVQDQKSGKIYNINVIENWQNLYDTILEGK